jgi:hypothetical protein
VLNPGVQVIAGNVYARIDPAFGRSGVPMLGASLI